MRTPPGFAAPIVMLLAFGGCGIVVATPDYEPVREYPEASLREHPGTGRDPQAVTPPSGDGPCSPHEFGDLKPKWLAPRRAYPGLCTLAAIDKAIDCAINWPPDCDAFVYAPKNADCMRCIFTQSDDPHGGALLIENQAYRTNLAGCIALMMDDLSPTGCGARMAAAAQCEAASCYECSHQDDSGVVDLKDLDDCYNRSATTVCADYASSAACGSDAENGRARICAKTDDLTADFLRYGGLFCGPPPGDGGALDGAALDAPDG